MAIYSLRELPKCVSVRSGAWMPTVSRAPWSRQGAWKHLEGVPVTCAGGKQGLRTPVANLEKPNLQVGLWQKEPKEDWDEPLSGRRRGEQRALARTPLLGIMTSLPEPFTVCRLASALQTVNHLILRKVQKGGAPGPARQAHGKWENAGPEPGWSGSLLLAKCPSDYFLINSTKRHRMLLRPRHSLKERSQDLYPCSELSKGICLPCSLHLKPFFPTCWPLPISEGLFRPRVGEPRAISTEPSPVWVFAE